MLFKISIIYKKIGKKSNKDNKNKTCGGQILKRQQPFYNFILWYTFDGNQEEVRHDSRKEKAM